MQIQNNTDDNEEGTRLFSKEKIQSFIQKQVNKRKPWRSSTITPPDSKVETPTFNEDNEDYGDNGNIENFDDLDASSSSRMIEDNTDSSKEDKKETGEDNAFVTWVKNNKLLTAAIGVGAAAGIFFAVKASRAKKTALAGTPELSGAKRKTTPKVTKKLSKVKPKKKKRKTAQPSIQRMALA